MKFQNREKAIIGLLIPGRSCCTRFAMPIPRTPWFRIIEEPGKHKDV